MLANQPKWIERLDRLHLLTPFRVLLIVIVAVILTLFVRVAVRRLLRHTIVLPGVEKTRADARQRALGSAVRGALVGIIWTAAAITVVSEVGINIGAFVATATVVGGAVAFGAQQLVRDVIAGMFVLAEDQYGVGDDVDLGLAKGTVERITLRSVRLRDGTGGVWYVPHGGVARVGNLSKSSVALLDLEVARQSALPALDAAAGQLCDALARHPDAEDKLVGAPRAVGVIDVRDDRLVYRLSVDTRPGHHDAVRRLWRLLALHAFGDGTLAAPLAQPAPTAVLPVDSAGAAPSE